jgi:hypothetical protein
MTDVNYRQVSLICKQCGIAFVSPRKQKYCSKRCCWTAQDRKKGVIPLAEYAKKFDPNANNRFVCEVCSKQTYRRLSGTNRKKGAINRFCSKDCMMANNLKLRLIRLEISPVVDETQVIQKKKIKAEIDALRRIGRYVSKPKIFKATCTKCSSTFIARRNAGLHQKVCKQCTDESKRKFRRIAKARRRAIERGVHAESIDPIKVFERAKWKCHLCGVKTIKALRGKYDALSPELEHIIPLSIGGTHTYGNVACSCRACNIKKGNKIIGQVSLELFA